ncbi:colicin-like pore-forming protein [Providencia rettgeri]
MSKNTMVVSVDDFYDGTYQPESPPDMIVVTAPPMEGPIGEPSFIEWWNDGYVDPLNVRPRPPSPPQPVQGHGKVQQPSGNINDVASDGSGIYTVNYHGRIYDVNIDKNGRATKVTFVKLDKHILKSISEKEAEKSVKKSAELSFRRWYSDKYITPNYKFGDNKKLLSENMIKNMLNSTRKKITDERAFFVRDTGFYFLKFYTPSFMTTDIENKISNFIKDSVELLNKEKPQLQEKNGEYYNRAIKVAEFTGVTEKAFDLGELDMVSTLYAGPFIDKSLNGKSLSKLADEGGTIEVKNRISLVKDIKNNKITAYLVKADGVGVGRNIPIIKAEYHKQLPTVPEFRFDLSDGKLTVGRTFKQYYDHVGFESQGSDNTLKSENAILPKDINLNFERKVESIKLPYEYQINDAIVVFPDGSNMNPIYVYYGYPKSRYIDELKNSERKRQEEQYDQLKTGIKATLDFYKELTEKLGVKAEKLAESLAASSKGKKIRNAEDALKAFEKYKKSLDKKYEAKDREAIAKALESKDAKLVADRFNKMSKVFYRAGKVMDYADLGNELYKAFKTDNWRPFFVKAETLIAGNTAGAATAFAFSIVLGGPVGIIGFALIMAAVGALVDEQLVEQINKILGI